MAEPVFLTNLVDCGEHPLSLGHPPEWADGWGEDSYGVFCEVTIEHAELRLRWIPPGQFLIGSPEHEDGRFDAEGPQTEITFASGFWLMDAPVTQALWEAVMGENPSRFVSKDRPVENVSWYKAQEFISALNGRLDGLALCLPSEAQWEYACRAGTREATYAGPMEIFGENNAPILNDIAFYGGNSGVGYELEDGADSSIWREKQFAHERAGTRSVRQKNPNPWGCYDMLGNVWEWCADDWAASHDGIDRAGAPRSVSQQETASLPRVVRGGSWSVDARNVRSAYRGRVEPEVSGDILGFRCASVQVSQASSGGQDDRPQPGREAEPRPVGPESDIMETLDEFQPYENAEAILEKARRSVDRMDLENAERLLSQERSEIEGTAKTAERLGDVRALQANWRGASNSYQRAARLEPTLERLQKASEHARLAGDFDAAVQLGEDMYERVQLHDIKPADFASAALTLARAYIEQGNFQEAEEILRKAIDGMRPDHPFGDELLGALAVVHYKTGRLDEAKVLFRQALELRRDEDQNFADLLRGYAQVLMASDQLVEAEELLRQALMVLEGTVGPVHPVFGLSLNVMAVLLGLSQRSDEAEEAGTKAHSILSSALGSRHPWTLKANADLKNLGGDRA